MQENFKQFKPYIDLINQIFEIERKAAQLSEANSIQRNVTKLKDILQSDFISQRDGSEPSGFLYDNPLGEKYSETRTDCEASIAGESIEDLHIVEVIKPIIRYKSGPNTQIVQKGIVVAASKSQSIQDS